MAIMIAKVWDSEGNKAEIEVIEFKTLKDAVKVINELQIEVKKLQEEIEKLKNGNSKHS